MAKAGPAAPFDAVIVNGTLDQVSETIVSQLKEGGHLIIPVDQNGNLDVLQKSAGQLVDIDIATCLAVSDGQQHNNLANL